MQIVAGISLKGIKPRVWDKNSPYYLPQLQAVMVSYAEFHQRPVLRRKVMEQGIRKYLGIPEEVKLYLDNGAFYFISRGGEIVTKDYEEFVQGAKPDWCPIPQDFIPTPKMSLSEQKECFTRTMKMNLTYNKDKQFIPVIHVSNFLEDYVIKVKKNKALRLKTGIALGGIVPNLLRAPKAIPYQKVLENLQHVREEFKDKKLHVFGIGGTATLHIAALLGINSVDSSGWRNRAARGIIQLPGTGERIVAELGKWKGRKLSQDEFKQLEECQCPACKMYGVAGLQQNGGIGFWNRATHNLWTLLEEARLIEQHLVAGTYQNWYPTHLDNTIYRPLIDQIIKISPSVNYTA
ncbi:hypothetical protein ACF3DV_34365 (plasmid) [Chlorogloeopsis fritschii PCC 9212]|uniref:tRNA-guanine(15) transglycosylase-like domain-containing protein n=1 Tax=Chlorogloeopsis fritschii PCC 6912 TaxID=211165 RepID=A0A3S1A8V1_CHLFR|nr:hypothetical protein [Chlorogloeopsis fritschii]RUR72603.1 hypothetical protein PCC6912_61600 [Chlorogloeopsis fritschii PCC 6912]